MEDASTLLDKLRRLEEELHNREARGDGKGLEALLHPEAEEFGRSGKRYGRDEILAVIAGGKQAPEIRARDYELSILADGVALLTYVSVHIDEPGQDPCRALRSSLWLRSGESWQLRFHQGTPINE